MIEDVLSRWEEEAVVLERNGLPERAAARRKDAQEVREAMPGYLLWLSESEAVLWASRRPEWLRQRFEAWEVSGHARRSGRHRYYRAAILPRGPDYIGVRALARKDAA